MKNEFISINQAVSKYGISQNKVRKIVKENKESNHVKKTPIKGKHGFKYLISVLYLDSLFTDVNEDKTRIKQSYNDNQLVIQLQTENKRLSKQIDNQNETIKGINKTLQEQQKVVIAQSLQISRLSEPINKHHSIEPQKTQSKILTFENIIIIILVGCIVAIISYLLT